MEDRNLTRAWRRLGRRLPRRLHDRVGVGNFDGSPSRRIPDPRSAPHFLRSREGVDESAHRSPSRAQREAVYRRMEVFPAP